MRRKDREVTDIQQIQAIVQKQKYFHLALFDEPCPYVVPLHYGFIYEAEGNTFTFYVHGAKEGLKWDLLKKNPHVCMELETDVQPLSGGDIPCAYGAAFASFIGRGTATILADGPEKVQALTVLMQHQTGRDFLITEKMAQAVQVAKIVIPEFSAKMNPLPVEKA